MQLSQIAAIAKVAEDVPELGRTAVADAEGTEFQSVFSDSSPVTGRHVPKIQPTRSGSAEQATVDAFGASDTSVPALATTETLSVRDGPMSMPGTEPAKGDVAVPLSVSAPDHPAKAGERTWLERPITRDGEAARTYAVGQPPTNPVRFDRDTGAGRIVGDAPPVPGVMPPEADRMVRQDAHLGHSSVQRPGAGGEKRPPSQPVGAVEAPTVAAIKATSSRGTIAVGPVADATEGAAQAPKPNGVLERAVPDIAPPAVERRGMPEPAGARPGLQFSETGDDRPPLRSDDAATPRDRLGHHDLPNRRTSVPMHARLSAQYPNSSAGEPRAESRDSPASVAAPPSLHGQDTAAIDPSISKAVPRGRSEAPAEYRLEARPAERAATPSVSDAPTGGRPDAVHPGSAADPASPIADAARVPAGGVAAAAPPGLGETSSGVDPDLSEAGLGEPRPLARASAPGPVTIFQAPETPRSAVMQIAEIIRASGERAVELRLQPEELGRLQLTMSQDASGTLSVALTAERPETLDLLRRNIELLGAELRELGYESIEFSFQGDGAPDKESLETSENGTRDTADTDNRAGENLNGNPTRDGRRSASGDSIDIRL